MKKAPWCPQNNCGAWGSLPRSLRCLPIHCLGTSLSLGTCRVEKECSLEGGPPPLPTSQASGIQSPDSAALSLSRVTIFICPTPGSTEQLEGAWPGITPFIFPFLWILGTKRGFLRRGGWPAPSHKSHKFQGIDRWGREQVISHPYEKNQR